MVLYSLEYNFLNLVVCYFPHTDLFLFPVTITGFIAIKIFVLFPFRLISFKVFPFPDYKICLDLPVSLDRQKFLLFAHAREEKKCSASGEFS